MDIQWLSEREADVKGEWHHWRIEGLGQELNTESWTSTYKAEDGVTLEVGSRGKSWEMPCVEGFDLLLYRFRRNGKGIHGTERTLKKGMGGGWWRDARIYRAQSVSMKAKCESVVSHVFSTALNRSVNWLWIGERVMRVKRWESKILRLTHRPRMKAGEGGLQEKDFQGDDNNVEENEATNDGR